MIIEENIVLSRDAVKVIMDYTKVLETSYALFCLEDKDMEKKRKLEHEYLENRHQFQRYLIILSDKSYRLAQK